MTAHERSCPDCDLTLSEVNRREFLKTASVAGAAALSAGSLPLFAQAADKAAASSAPESVVTHLYQSLSAEQKKVTCFGWDHTESERGLLRTRVANNWHITEPEINSDFYNDDQRAMIRDIFEGIIHPDWHARIDRQLEDDAGGYGEAQNIAIFGTPGEGKYEFVMTGRHMTIRCDGDSADHVAFGGPIFYGHAAQGFNEKPDHPGNVFWPQALEANKVYEMLSGKQREAALVASLPREQSAGFRADGQLPGLPVAEMSGDQREQVQKVLAKLIEPYRQNDRDEALACINSQGGLDQCSLAFYREGDIGEDQVWDCWRLEGPALVWYFRGAPHVHCWVNVANSPSVKLNA
jgi:hypothetical protein